MKLVYRCAKLAGIAILGLGVLPANAAVSTHQRKAKKTQAQPLPPLPSGPTGPVPAIPLDSMTPVPPQVTYENGQLTIFAPNSTLADILRAVRKQTGAEIDVPAATDRVVTRLGPGPVQEVMSELLNGSRFNYVLLGSPENSGALTRVVLVPKSGAAENAVNQPMQGQQTYANQQAANVGPPDATDTTDAEPVDENANAADNSDPQPDQDQSGSPDQPAVKTPQQLLQEMQQRQLLLQQQQQQQQPGQPPIPGAGVPQRPEQDQ